MKKNNLIDYKPNLLIISSTFLSILLNYLQKNINFDALSTLLESSSII